MLYSVISLGCKTISSVKNAEKIFFRFQFHIISGWLIESDSVFSVIFCVLQQLLMIYWNLIIPQNTLQKMPQNSFKVEIKSYLEKLVSY